MNKNKYQILSPDGIIIDYNVQYYSSIKKAKIAFYEWLKKYEFQGYYSYNFEKIPLDEVYLYCQFKKI